MNGIEVAFLPRHGKNHTIPPHMINYRANIYALKQLGIERIISPCAVGSLKEEYKPGDMVIVDQFIDFTKSRKYTFLQSRSVALTARCLSKFEKTPKLTLFLHSGQTIETVSPL